MRVDTKKLNSIFRGVLAIAEEDWIIAAIRDPKVKQPNEGDRLKQLVQSIHNSLSDPQQFTRYKG